MRVILPAVASTTLLLAACCQWGNSCNNQWGWGGCGNDPCNYNSCIYVVNDLPYDCCNSGYYYPDYSYRGCYTAPNYGNSCYNYGYTESWPSNSVQVPDGYIGAQQSQTMPGWPVDCSVTTSYSQPMQGDMESLHQTMNAAEIGPASTDPSSYNQPYTAPPAMPEIN